MSSRKWFSTFAANVSSGTFTFCNAHIELSEGVRDLERFDIFTIAFADFLLHFRSRACTPRFCCSATSPSTYTCWDGSRHFERDRQRLLVVQVEIIDRSQWPAGTRHATNFIALCRLIETDFPCFTPVDWLESSHTKLDFNANREPVSVVRQELQHRRPRPSPFLKTNVELEAIASCIHNRCFLRTTNHTTRALHVL